jgi:hypothetical protein
MVTGRRATCGSIQGAILEIIFGELALGDALLGVEDLVRARQPDALDLDLLAHPPPPSAAAISSGRASA